MTISAIQPTYIHDDDLQAMINAMPGSRESNYRDPVWFFRFDHKPMVTISFVDLYTLVARYPEWYKRLGVDIVRLSKQAWLDSVSLVNSDKWNLKLSGITLFWTALAENNTARLTSNNLKDVMRFLLTHSWRQSKHFRLIGIQSSTNFNATISISKWRGSFLKQGEGIIDFDITDPRIEKMFANLLPEISDGMTYADWKAGGNYNRLTLDHGQYYIEHCMNFFLENVDLAIALESTFRKVPELAKTFEFCEISISRFVTKILEGKSLLEISLELYGVLPWITEAEKLGQIFRACIEHFETTYRKEKFKTIIMSDVSLRNVLESLKIECSQHNIDRIKALAWNWLKNGKTDQLQTLCDNFHPTICVHKFDATLRAMEIANSHKSISIPTLERYQSLGLELRSSSHDSWKIYPRQLVKLAGQAGLTSIVALTGWRKTEYGFPLTSISQTPNQDILDQYAFPMRYEIEWYVKKTHGRHLVKREITFDIALYIERLALLIGSEKGRPCLYRNKSKISHYKDESGRAVTDSVGGLWEHFVKHYTGFKKISELVAWREISKTDKHLTQDEIAEKSRLLLIRSENEWDKLDLDVNLYECWQRAREEFDLVNFVGLRINKSHKVKWLSKYREGTLKAEWRELVDQRVSPEIRARIMSLTNAEALDKVTAREINYLIAGDCLYPTPHALRHMFAEAIYRRFDGDVGWMIRSCFKHITRMMWQAYIKDKFNRASADVAKLQLMNSIVLNYIRKKGVGYAGPIQKWLRRLLRHSSIMTAEEQFEFANRITTVEIVDIKASPWGYCMLKKRSKRRAHCATLGEPQRQNASPNLCLSCTHNLVQSGNVDWLLLHIQAHVSTLGNQLIPDLFRRSSYDLVKNALKQILNIAPTHEAVQELQLALDNYAGA